MHTLLQTGADGSESVSVVPNKLKGNCEALLLVISALDGDTGASSLTNAGSLDFKLATLGKSLTLCRFHRKAE